MKSEIRFISPSFKLGVTIGLMLVILIIFFSVWFRFEVSLILLAVAGSVAMFGLATVTLATGQGILKLYSNYHNLRLIKYQADKAQMESYVLNFPKTQRLVTLPEKNIKVIEAIAEQAAMLPASTEQAAIELLPALENEQRVLIKGVSNAGKTNLLQWIASRKITYSKVLVIDPHASPEKWHGCQVIGLGSNHNEIAIALDKLIDLMIERYQDIAQGLKQEGQHKPLTVIVDEWMSIAYQCDNAKAVMVRLLTESRKAAFSVYVGSHSDRVASLGLDGKGDLRDGFCLVRLSIVNGTRQATIDYGNGELPVLLPGAFVGSNGQVIDTGYIDLEVQPNQTEAAILTLYEQGNSKKEISEQVFNSVGGNQYKKIDNVLSKFGAL